MNLVAIVNMLFLDVSIDSVLRGYWTSFWNLYGTDILTLSAKITNDENVRDKSCRIYKLQQYYLAFDLAYLIKIELNRGTYLSEDYYETKYSIEDKREKLACNGISLDRLFTIFGIE